LTIESGCEVAEPLRGMLETISTVPESVAAAVVGGVAATATAGGGGRAGPWVERARRWAPRQR